MFHDNADPVHLIIDVNRTEGNKVLPRSMTIVLLLHTTSQLSS